MSQWTGKYRKAVGPIGGQPARPLPPGGVFNPATSPIILLPILQQILAELQGGVADSVTIKDGNSALLLDVEADGAKNAAFVQSNSLATQATLAALNATVAASLDATLSSRATEATLLAAKAVLDLIKAKTDNLDAALSTRATEATLALIKTKTDNLDITLTALAALLETVTVVQGTSPWLVSGIVDVATMPEVEIKNDLGNPIPISAASLPLPSGAATEATLDLIKAKTDNLDMTLTALAALLETTTANQGTPNAGGANSWPVTTEDGKDVALGAKADAAATTDTGTFSLIALFKRWLSQWTTNLLTTGGQTGTKVMIVGDDDKYVRGAQAHDTAQVGGPVVTGGTATADPENNIGQFTEGFIINRCLDLSGRTWIKADSFSGTLTVNTEFPAAASAGDAQSNPTTPSVRSFGSVFNGSTWDRMRSIINALNSTGTGIVASGLIAQLDDTSPSAVTENQFAIVRMNSLRDLRIAPPMTTRADTYTAAASGTTVDRSQEPVKWFSLQVKATGAVTSWTVLLEGSNDNVNWTTILTHTNAAPGDGLLIANTLVPFPCLYIRTRCSAIVLGGGTNVVATLLGVD